MQRIVVMLVMLASFSGILEDAFGNAKGIADSIAAQPTQMLSERCVSDLGDVGTMPSHGCHIGHSCAHFVMSGIIEPDNFNITPESYFNPYLFLYDSISASGRKRPPKSA